MLDSYPSLTAAKFRDACTNFEARCHDNLSGTDWLSVQWTGQELLIAQARLASRHTNEANIHDAEEENETGDIEIDGGDEEEALKRPADSERIQIDFSITLSPTYSVPVLWFTSNDLKTADHVHSLLLVPHHEQSVRSVGVMGGISRAYHPVSDLPSFFVHPCNTHEALSAVNDGENLTAEEYLVLWLGVTGAAVGLHVPSPVMAQ